MLGDDGRGSILTASPFSLCSTIGVLGQYELLLYESLVPGAWYVWSPYHTKKKCLFLPRAARKMYTPIRKFKNEVTNRRGKKGSSMNLKKYCIINGLIQYCTRARVHWV